MFGTMFFVSQYLQFVLGYSALKSGAALIPIAGALMIAAPTSAGLVRAFGTKRIVAAGLLLVAVALLLFSRVTTTSGYGLVGAVLVIVGLGMGLAMAPATDSIMGSVPPAKAGVGSAMNDTTREIGGALGVAILGSITNAVYSSTITGNPAFPALQQASPQLADAVQESIGSAVVAAQTVGGTVGDHHPAGRQPSLRRRPRRPTAIVAAVVAVGGAAVAYFFLPARAATADTGDPLVDAAAEFTPISDAERRTLASLTLGMLADAGMSSLTYNAIAAQSGISTTTLQANWPTRIDAITDALNEIYKSRPIPDTGDLAADLDDYLHELAAVLATARARQVLGALIAEAVVQPGARRRAPMHASSNPGAPPSPPDSPTNPTTSPSRSPPPSTSSPARSTSGPCSPTRHPTTTSSTPSCVHSSSPIAMVAWTTGGARRRAARIGMMQIGVVFPQTEIGADLADVRAYATGSRSSGSPTCWRTTTCSAPTRRSTRDWPGPYDVTTTFHEPFVLFGYLAAITPASSWSPASSSCPSARPRSSPSRPPRSTC